MAKRKRLSPAALSGSDPQPEDGPALETKAMNGWVGVRRRAPIADVTADAATRAALEEVSAELRSAKVEGRMVVSLPLEAVEDSYLVRDRLRLDPDELVVLLKQATPFGMADDDITASAVRKHRNGYFPRVSTL